MHCLPSCGRLQLRPQLLNPVKEGREKGVMKTAALGLAIVFALAANAVPAAAQRSHRPVATQDAPVTAKRSLFSGTETRVAELGWLRLDCTTSSPDIRVVKAPAHGDVRFEEGKALVAADQTALQKQCHGKPVDALRIYYTASANYTGGDAFTVDVDTKLGFVKRYIFTMDVR